MFELPQKTKTLKVLEALEKRTVLSNDDCYELYRQRAGHKGEMHFAKLARGFLPTNAQIMYSVLLEHANSYFQIDSMIFTQEKIFLIDLKNFRSEYVYGQSEFVHLKHGRKINNPLHQLNRCKLLLNEFLERHQYSQQIDAHLVFINSDFFLYESPVLPTLVFHPQVPRFLKKITQAIQTAPLEGQQLLNLFKENHIENSPHDYLPIFKEHELQKGILCLTCGEQMTLERRYHLKCPKCSHSELVTSGILRTIVEYSNIFPERKIVPRKIHHWIGGIITLRWLTKIMRQHMLAIGRSKSLHFEFYRRYETNSATSRSIFLHSRDDTT